MKIIPREIEWKDGECKIEKVHDLDSLLFDDADSIENKAKFIKEHKKVFNMDYILLKKTSFVTEDMFELWDETGSFGFSDPDKFLSDIIYAMLKASR